MSKQGRSYERIAVVLCAALAAGSAQAALTKIDVNAGASSSPAEFTQLGSYIYFAATGAGVGKELYRTNGSTATLVEDIYVGSGSGSPLSLAVMGSYVYFSATNGPTPPTQYGEELWRSDGTTTAMVRNINLGIIGAAGPQAWGSAPRDLINVNGQLFFTANTNNLQFNSGREVWVSDGTSGGTVITKDLTDDASSCSAAQLTAVGSILYLRAHDLTDVGLQLHGTDLFRSDGTEIGTYIVQDISTGVPSSSPVILGVVGSFLYFGADDGTNGKELWRTNGTTTELAATGSSSPEQGAVLGTKLLFRATDGVDGRELWSFETTTDTPALVKDIWSGSSYGYPTELTTVGSVVYFRANDNIHGYELWTTDGTTGGTAMVKDLMLC